MALIGVNWGLFGRMLWAFMGFLAGWGDFMGFLGVSCFWGGGMSWDFRGGYGVSWGFVRVWGGFHGVSWGQVYPSLGKELAEGCAQRVVVNGVKSSWRPFQALSPGVGTGTHLV